MLESPSGSTFVLQPSSTTALIVRLADWQPDVGHDRCRARLHRRRVSQRLLVGLCMLITGSLGAQARSPIRSLGGVDVGAPLLFSGFVAAVWDRGFHTWPSPEGPFVGIEVGVNGAIVSLGRAYSYDGAAALLKGGLLRPFNGERLYVGGDARFMVIGCSLGFGAYARVRGRTGWSVLPAITVGFGF